MGEAPDPPSTLSIHCCGPSSEVAVSVMQNTMNKNNGEPRERILSAVDGALLFTCGNGLLKTM